MAGVSVYQEPRSANTADYTKAATNDYSCIVDEVFLSLWCQKTLKNAVTIIPTSTAILEHNWIQVCSVHNYFVVVLFKFI